MRTLVAIPVYNEEKYIHRVLSHVLQYADDVLVIDDGSTDRTPLMLPKYPIDIIRHAKNAGYGLSLLDAFSFADHHGYDWVITMDCDEQHEPASIPRFVEAARENTADLISGSRYIASMDESTTPPADRRAVNVAMTTEINDRLGLTLTDSFCGFKAHRISAMRRLALTERGYAFPMQLWPQAVAQGLRISEIPVKLIYKDLTRSFGATLDDPHVRLAHYRCVLHREIEKHAELLPPAAMAGLVGCSDCDEDPG